MAATGKGKVPPGRSKLQTVDLGIEGEPVPLHAHAAYFWETDQEFADAIGFLEVGLRGPDHCVVFGHDEANQAVCRILRERGFDIEALQARGRLSVLGGAASGQEILRTIAARFEHAVATGAPLIRLLGNIGWRKQQWPDEEDLLAFEAKVTAAAAQFPCVVVCMYDVVTLPAFILRHGAFETHPIIVPRGSVRQNPYYVPTDVFLERLETIAADIGQRRRIEKEIHLLETTTRVISEADDLPSALRAVLRHVCETAGWSLAHAWIPRPDASCLEFSAWHGSAGVGEDSQKVAEGMTFLPDMGLPGRAWSSKQPVWVPDITREEDSPLALLAREAGMKAALAFPVLAGDAVVAVMAFFAPAWRRGDERFAKIVATVAAQLGLVIQHKRAQAASRQYSATLERLVEERTAELRRSEEHQRLLLEINNALISNLTREALFRAVAQALRRVLPFDRTAIFLHDHEKEILRLYMLEAALPSSYFSVGLEMPPGESHVGWVFQHRRPLLRHDLERERQYPMEDRAYEDGVRSYIIVPLVVRGECIGTLAVASVQTNQYSEVDVSFLQEAANQVALAVENMQAYEAVKHEVALRRQAEEMLRAIMEGTAAVTGADFFPSLVRHLASARRVRFAFVTESLGGAVTRVRSLAFWKGEGFGQPLEYEVAGTPCQEALEGKVAFYPRDVGRLFPGDRDLIELRAESYLGVPIFDASGKVIGHLAILDDRPMEQDDRGVATLKVFAARAGAELQRQRAEEALRKALVEVEQLKNRLQAENIYLQEEIRGEHNFMELVGSSPTLLTLLRKVEQVAPTDSTVLILGETGTGKELIGRAIHSRSARKDRPLVKVDCSAISAGLVESELFGHVKGAFTGALERRVGRFELASGATIFLDEVGELPLETQAKLLRVLQEQQFEPVGSNRTVRVDVRVIAATNRDLQAAVRAGRFRSDLFYRLNVFPLEIPPLRDRRSDIPQLVMFFLSRFAKRFGKKVDSVSRDTMDRLVNYPWPGNVRELQNIIERAVVICQGPVLELDRDLLPTPTETLAATEGAAPPRTGTRPAPQEPSKLPTLEEIERTHILAALRESGGVIDGPKGAAKILNLHPNTMRSRMEKLGIKRTRHEIS